MTAAIGAAEWVIAACILSALVLLVVGLTVDK